ncbi:MAG: glutamate--tRNA ligase [Arcobacter butzleri]|nr:glutamate--tRNA ligase [Arcobacteraceae bacterium]NLO17594.1 glutamate--tRNA ligase [Aliarcobacter butzleri]
MLRFAPSPTGDMHIGNLRVALFNYILSKQLKEDLIIRIEDTDKERNIEGKDKEILQMLELFGIEYKMAHYQSDNLKYHQQFAMQLLVEKKAFACFCSDERLDVQREDAKQSNKPYRYDGHCEVISDEEVLNNESGFTVRIKKPSNSIKCTDELRGEFNYDPFDVDSFIIMRKDKTPTYNFACAIDDMLYDISLVIRGEDHLSNTPKQKHIRDSLGYTKEIKYLHLPIILNAQTGKKMSKRDNASSIQWLIDEGFLPIAIANYLVLLGCKTPKEIFTIEEAIVWFDIKSISTNAPKFDIDKLRFINKEHLKTIDELRLSKILGYADSDIGSLAKVYLEEASTTKELKGKLNAIFSPKITQDDYEKEVETIKKIALDMPFFDQYDDFKNYISNQSGLKGKSLFMPLRFCLTGVWNGPNISDIYPYIKNYLQEIIK